MGSFLFSSIDAANVEPFREMASILRAKNMLYNIFLDLDQKEEELKGKK